MEEKLLAQKIRDITAKILTDERPPKEASKILNTGECVLTCTKLAANNFETCVVPVTME